MKEIPINIDKKGELVEILTPETSVFSLFIPLTKIDDNLCPIPECFLSDLARQAKFFHERGMQYLFATDSHSMSEAQYTLTREMLKTIGVEVFDISTLPEYIPYDNSFNTYPCSTDAKTLYNRLTKSSAAEYIDKTKVMLANLAGKQQYGNVLVTDFDIFINDSSLKVIAGDGVSFTFSGRHEKPSTNFDTENSMIFLSKERAKNTEGNDLVAQVLSRVRGILEPPSRGNLDGAYGCFVFSTLCHDPIVAANLPKAKEILLQAAKDNISKFCRDPEEKQEQLIELQDSFEMMFDRQYPDVGVLLYPSGINDSSEDLRAALTASTTSSGRYLIHGDYFSPNAETWKNPQSLSFINFEQAKHTLTEEPENDKTKISHIGGLTP